MYGFASYFLYMIFFIIPVSNDDLNKSSKKEFLCELYNDVKFLLSNKFNLKIVQILLFRKSYYLTSIAKVDIKISHNNNKVCF